MSGAATSCAYAVALLNRGFDAQSVSLICRIPTESIRQLGGTRRRRNEYRPPEAKAALAPAEQPVLDGEPYGPPMPSRREMMLATINGVARRYGLETSDLIGPNRARPVAFARHEAMSVVKDRWGLSLPRVGQLFGDRDHTTVRAGIQSHADRSAWCAVVSAMARAA